MILGVAGTLPSATANDTADFTICVPWNMTLKRLKATVKSAPSSNTTFQVRRATVSTFSNYFGSVTINSSAIEGAADPSDADVNEGDLLQISITAGGGSGSNAAVEIIGVPR
jgi:hypothetical protein